MAARDASPSWEDLVERPSSSITTGMGMTIVQRRLSMTVASMDSEDSRMLVSTTSMVYPGMTDRAARTAGLFRGARGQRRREGGDEDMAGPRFAAWIRLLRYLRRA